MFTFHFLLFCALYLFVDSKPAVGNSLKNSEQPGNCRYGRRFRQSMPIFLGGKDCCIDAAGEEHGFGEKWMIGHLMYECNDGGYEITALTKQKQKRKLSNTWNDLK
uniref:Uncharacterized protein n=1 Tax=Plectus sambesii TaxID=2011161 RepID=A0A914V679_9BILA